MMADTQEDIILVVFVDLLATSVVESVVALLLVVVAVVVVGLVVVGIGGTQGGKGPHVFRACP